ncbi:hypothetical protein QSV36_06075 [Pseudomonas sp. BCRC 81390]|nr:hypothetical protein [Pseudomonas sp. BCRC 81390]MDM3885173.1 hypothetical protein [Pseudomonas sp. BCRC 81390]
MTSVEQKRGKALRLPAKGTVIADISLAGQGESFVSEGVDYGANEKYAALYAYKGEAADAEVFIDFLLEVHDGVRDITIDEQRNQVLVHKRGTTYGGYARSGTIRQLEMTATRIKAESFECEGLDDLQRPFRVVGRAFDIVVINPSIG